MKRRLVAALACRNQGSRLYGKPVQNLDVESGYRIIDNIVACLQSIDTIDDIVLGVAEGQENELFCEIAREKGIKHIVGDEVDVLGRLIRCADIVDATDVFRITSESPFPYFEVVDKYWQEHLALETDALFMDDIVDGSNFEIIRTSALKASHDRGEDRHRSELCTLYLRENMNDFKIAKRRPSEEIIRKDLRLTVDNPEDLVACRAIYSAFKDQAPKIKVSDIIAYLDQNPDLVRLTAPFTDAGYSTMYL